MKEITKEYDNILEVLEDVLSEVFGHVPLDVTVKVNKHYYENNNFSLLIKDRFENSGFVVKNPKLDYKDCKFTGYTTPGVLTINLEKNEE